MWSKTRKKMNDLLADSLKKKIVYNYEVHTTNKYKYYCEMHVFYIYWNKKTIYATNPMGDWETNKEIGNMMGELYRKGEITEHFEVLNRISYPAFCKAVYNTGYVLIESFMKYLHEYLYSLSIEEAMKSDNYVFHMLAMFDRRLGKRRIAEILNRIDEEPEWFQKFVLIRAEAEGTIKIENYDNILL